jgi:hypothetical protein
MELHMGIKDFLEEAAGGFAAEKGLDALDPNANLLEKGLAAAAGYEGVKLVKDHFDGEQDAAQPQASDDSWNSDAQANDDTQPTEDQSYSDSQDDSQNN